VIKVNKTAQVREALQSPILKLRLLGLNGQILLHDRRMTIEVFFAATEFMHMSSHMLPRGSSVAKVCCESNRCPF
jgi:hypothetical protein